MRKRLERGIKVKVCMCTRKEKEGMVMCTGSRIHVVRLTRIHAVQGHNIKMNILLNLHF